MGCYPEKRLIWYKIDTIFNFDQTSIKIHNRVKDLIEFLVFQLAF